MVYKIQLYSKNETSEAELLEMKSNHDFGNGMTEQKQGLPSLT